ncbi:UbiA-like protein EboC [Allomuricauda sp. SCSIO 65647]|uniref:UbiA-like protein EboC n=1 Tax=Allomuricauda sp. SCSIO 65647 TaxID=2908843 RepID=UPI001F2FEB31|nr:UbiA-like protein EboC [Muricauda sp. SCSIO 65647]UJH66937.1 UbiA-like protein EboC [Muricauda sp. SCSIO 65647]
MRKLKAYLQLCRPANLPTAAADIMAGFALAGFWVANQENEHGFEGVLMPMFTLVTASILLYAGGVVLNDFFDRDIDRVERPERPIPKGVVRAGNVLAFGLVLLLTGVLLSFLWHSTSGFVSLALAFSIVAYDAFSKKSKVLGPLNMGLCRALNLLLGISVFGYFTHLEYLIIPLIFIAAVTLISRGEVHGNNQKSILLAGILYVLVIFCVIFFQESRYMVSLPFIVLFALMVFLPLLKAYRVNTADNIKKAVKAGVLSIILLDAAIVAGHSNVVIALMTLLLLPLSVLLSKAFAVT